MYSGSFWKTDLVVLRRYDKDADVILHVVIFAYSPEDSTQDAFESYEEIISAKLTHNELGEIVFETTHRGEHLSLSPNEKSGAIGVTSYKRNDGLEVVIVATEYAYPPLPLCLDSKYGITAQSEYIASFESESQRDIVLNTLNTLEDQKLRNFVAAGPFKAFDKNITKECSCTKMFTKAAVILNKAYEDMTKAHSTGALLVFKQYYDTVIALFQDLGFNIQRNPDTGEHTVKYASNNGTTNLFSSEEE